MSGHRIDPEAAARRLGPAAAEARRVLVAEAPPLTAEQFARLRVLFAPVVAERPVVARRDAA
ncbi:hypothetical protein ACLIYP_05390 [Streptomyces nanhaiensis]|uniref:hypothetical protein n=1 Tax=Streptomyces nanhaiensis TaxID=679319 RepID=UPI00399C4CEB